MINIPRISVLVITYKQEELIKRSIDSLLMQKDYLYEICISDDCSPDNTWHVLKEYSMLYPGLFKLHRNERNLGIFQNVEQSWTMPTGDLVYQLSGDDECPDGWFKAIINYIENNNIDYLNTCVCFYGDFKCQYPNGDYFVKSNKMAVEGFDLVSLSMRNMIGNRSACYSTSIMKKYQKVSCERSYVAEWAQEIQLALFTEKAYYIHQLGNIYYTRIGVNVSFNHRMLQERVDNFPYMKECLEKWGYTLSKKDSTYVKLQKLKYSQIVNWNLKTFLKIQLLKISAKDCQYGFLRTTMRSFKRKLFALLRRMPHNKPIVMEL